MSTYVNVGHAVRFPKFEGPTQDTVRGFGHQFELEDDYAREIIAADTPVMPLAAFQSVGFTEDQLKRYVSPAKWPEADAAFHVKLKACWGLLHDIRERAKAGDPLWTPPGPKSPPVPKPQGE